MEPSVTRLTFCRSRAPQEESSPLGTLFLLGLLLAAAGQPGCAGRGASPPPSAQAPGPDSPASTEAPPEEGGVSVPEAGGDTPPPEEEPPAPAPPLPIPEGTTVLHVGDSFAAALGLPLNRLLKEHGVRAVLEYETASYIPGWSAGDKLQRLLWKYNPDLVLVTLGANELEIVEPTQRIRNIRRIVSTLGERPCVWIATPLWAGAKNGLMDIIRDNVAPCRYMDTNQLIDGMARGPDGIHPTTAAREDWAKVVLSWLQSERRPTEERPWSLSERPDGP